MIHSFIVYVVEPSANFAQQCRRIFSRCSLLICDYVIAYTNFLCFTSSPDLFELEDSNQTELLEFDSPIKRVVPSTKSSRW